MAAKKEKKLWYEILSSKEFNESPIGETSTYDINSLKGRVVNVNLGMLTRDPRSQNIQIGFEVNEIKENKCHTRIKNCSLVSSYIKRIVKIGRSKDKVRLKIKPLVLTRYKVQNKVLTELRRMIRGEVLDYLKKEDADKFISELIYKKIQKELKGKLSKVYPIGTFEFRIVQRL